jgi:23S rRNA pseudouridine1911/1915/1917 synthase
MPSPEQREDFVGAEAGTHGDRYSPFPLDSPATYCLRGAPDPPSGVWKDRLVWDQEALIQKETHPRDPRGKEAVCRYELVERYRGASLLEVRLMTGKRNQIRLQARLRGHTLVGERRYVYGPDDLRPIEFPRQALHAYRLEFAHPDSGETLRFESPIPRDLSELIARLRRDT